MGSPRNTFIDSISVDSQSLPPAHLLRTPGKKKKKEIKEKEGKKSLVLRLDGRMTRLLRLC